MFYKRHAVIKKKLVNQWCVLLSYFRLFSRDKATLYEGVSVGPSVRRMVRLSVTSYFFGLQGATYAVYTAFLIGAYAAYLKKVVIFNIRKKYWMRLKPQICCPGLKFVFPKTWPRTFPILIGVFTHEAWQWGCVVLSFLDASSHLYMRPFPSVVWLVGPSIGKAFVQIDEKWTFFKGYL